MTLSVSDTARLSRKLGFGLRPEEDLPADFIEWAAAQLEAVPPQMGIAHFDQMSNAAPMIAPWPSQYERSIDEIETAISAMHKAFDKLDKDFARGSPEHEQGKLELDAKYNRRFWDVLRHSHQPVFGPAPVFERFAHFWANHFTVGAKDNVEHAIGHYLREAIQAHMIGDFRTLLYEVTTHPAMQNYLDNYVSIGPNSPVGKYERSQGLQSDINENLARELLELHTVSPSANYTQDDVIGAARILSGWGYTFGGNDFFNDKKERWKVFYEDRNEPGKKTVLGQQFPFGRKALEQLTDFLGRHDHTIEHISGKLARYFIADAPDDADIAAIVHAWRDSDGDLPAIHRAVIERATAYAGPAKFQQPEPWLYQMLRLSGGSLFVGFDDLGADGRPTNSKPVENLLNELGQYYWSTRQPNGFSDQKADWISPELLERRIRFAQLTASRSAVILGADDLVDRLDLSAVTRSLVASGTNHEEKFVLLFCSPEMMEA